MSDKNIESRQGYVLEKLEIPEYKNKKIKELSKGNSQKVQFIMSIINSPKLLILDEPFSGLDPINIELFKKLILELKSEWTSIIFSSHRMEHVEYFCESLVILVHGKTVLKGNLKQIKEDYQKKNIMIESDADMEDLKNIKGVEKVDKIGNTFVVSISE